jgi:hypothetical protein
VSLYLLQQQGKLITAKARFFVTAINELTFGLQLVTSQESCSSVDGFAARLGLLRRLPCDVWHRITLVVRV